MWASSLIFAADSTWSVGRMVSMATSLSTVKNSLSSFPFCEMGV